LALTSLNRQLVDAYRTVGTTLAADAAWQQISATAMIGQNDVVDERFELSDAQELVTFAKLHHLARLSMWSANRDQECGINYADPEVVSDDCSGVNQPAGAFGAVFETFSTPGTPAPKTPRKARASDGAANAMAATPTAEQTDNPATSPYAIWNPNGAYAKGTKIVWHHNVYEAKWWTQGDVPDAPVTDPDDTPWTLIGPVLPGEHPARLPTLSAGTFPQWSAIQVYEDGDRVLYDGVGYQAKWWNQGQAPTPDPPQPSDTPWQLITS
jgi:chitinase